MRNGDTHVITSEWVATHSEIAKRYAVREDLSQGNQISSSGVRQPKCTIRKLSSVYGR